jgi:hypothetical protein
MSLIKSSELDFDNIKASLKSYLQSKSEFSDYDFEASGLSNILDVLAYNTHVNGLTANVGLNEAFLSSAQLRSSVVSHAETLGYYARSKTGSTAVINLSAQASGESVSTVSIPPQFTFSTTVDEVNYTFQTTETLTATNNGSGGFVFKNSSGNANIRIKEGTLKTKNFIVGNVSDDQVFVIPDTTIDTSTLKVYVYDSTTSSTYTEYSNINDTVRINTDSTVYIIREVPNGYFELTFSDGNVLGKSPVAGNKIVVTYLSVKGAVVNGASVFTPDDTVKIGLANYNLAVTLVSKSAGGDDKESISSIKSNAPIAFASQQRLVTAEDYKALIAQRYSSFIDDVIAWGGADNVPPIYGRVYVSLKFKDGIDEDTRNSVKDSIRSQLGGNLAIMSIDTVFTDPTNTYLECTTRFNFDPDLSGDTVETIQSTVQSTINQYFEDNLTTFDAVFRRSLLLAVVDNISPAILNSRMDVKVQQRWSPILNNQSDFTVNFPVAIAAPDDVEYIVSSGLFKDADGATVYFRNKLEETKLELIDNTTGAVKKDNIGTYNQGLGTVNLVGMEISDFSGDSIKISVKPANQSTVKPLRNYILTIDANKSSSSAVLDFQNTAVSLSL